MKKFRTLTILIVSTLSVLISNCNVATFESNNTGNSHYAGTNCLSCHSSGENTMTLAGTVYTNSSGVSTQTDGTLTVNVTSGGSTYKIPVDQSGNFYTDYPVEFPAQVAVSNGNAMSASVSSGGCNSSSCHDSSRRIY